MLEINVTNCAEGGERGVIGLTGGNGIVRISFQSYKWEKLRVQLGVVGGGFMGDVTLGELIEFEEN
jgi:hypothetical protein